MSDYKFKKIGKGVTIYPTAKIINPENITIGDYSQIDDFVFIYAKEDIRIGKHCHIAVGVKIIGIGELLMRHHSAIAQNAVILMSTNDYRSGYHMSAASPKEQQSIKSGIIIIGKDAFVGAGSIVHPNVEIGEGAIIGTNSVVLKDVEPWTINVGSPCKVIGTREKVRFV